MSFGSGSRGTAARLKSWKVCWYWKQVQEQEVENSMDSNRDSRVEDSRDKGRNRLVVVVLGILHCCWERAKPNRGKGKVLKKDDDDCDWVWLGWE
jgi:hypothetical protein